MSQLTFFDILPDTWWVEVKANSGHKVYEGGERFLVIEKEEDGWLLCWKDGIRPACWPLTKGTLVHRKYVRDIERR